MNVADNHGDIVQGAAGAAAYLGVKPRTIYHLAEKGLVPVIRKGKLMFFRKSELDAAFRSEAA